MLNNLCTLDEKGGKKQCKTGIVNVLLIGKMQNFTWQFYSLLSIGLFFIKLLLTLEDRITTPIKVSVSVSRKTLFDDVWLFTDVIGLMILNQQLCKNRRGV